MAYEEQLPNLDKFYEGLTSPPISERTYEKLVKDGEAPYKKDDLHANQNVLIRKQEHDKPLICRFHVPCLLCTLQ